MDGKNWKSKNGGRGGGGGAKPTRPQKPTGPGPRPQGPQGGGGGASTHWLPYWYRQQAGGGGRPGPMGPGGGGGPMMGPHGPGGGGLGSLDPNMGPNPQLLQLIARLGDAGRGGGGGRYGGGGGMPHIGPGTDPGFAIGEPPPGGGMRMAPGGPVSAPPRLRPRG